MNAEKEDMVFNWIQEEGNPAIEKLTEMNLETAGRVAAILKDKGIEPIMLAQLVDTQVTEVNRWLNGKHNFSEKFLKQITEVLNIES
ncbi:MAG: XRE family transcriptional regulator [Chitinophagaceae bacterium]|nr:MAG: XRE family transcriptional regulator [Chitinophagaceae bacterium]